MEELNVPIVRRCVIAELPIKCTRLAKVLKNQADLYKRSVKWKLKLTTATILIAGR